MLLNEKFKSYAIILSEPKTSFLIVFKKELEKDVAGDTSGNFAKLLLALVQVRFVNAHRTYDSYHYHYTVETDLSRVLFLCRPREQNHPLL